MRPFWSHALVGILGFGIGLLVASKGCPPDPVPAATADSTTVAPAARNGKAP